MTKGSAEPIICIEDQATNQNKPKAPLNLSEKEQESTKSFDTDLTYPSSYQLLLERPKLFRSFPFTPRHKLLAPSRKIPCPNQKNPNN
jgi:hypothetical protein